MPMTPGPAMPSKSLPGTAALGGRAPSEVRADGGAAEALTVTGLDTESTADHLVFQPIAWKKAGAHHP